ncbi:MAG: 16S rRNA (adenine(1518)-N(6)/adenine(1519)-N(6))-dimethyltransferase RsmA [Burkholderiales bacterium]
MPKNRLPAARGTNTPLRHLPRKRFGQHFLADASILDRLVVAIAPRDDELFVEIGPGEGALTRRLLAVVPHMDAVEIDRDLAAGLRNQYGAQQLTLVEGDALDTDFSSFPQGIRVVGNLPYNISTPLIFHLCDFAGHVIDMHFMLQKEVVLRMAAVHSTPEYGRLSVMTQFWFEVEPLFEVPASAFRPPPKVQSMTVRLRPRDAKTRAGTDPLQLKRLVTAAFSHRRKTLKNALEGVLNEEILIRLGIDPGLRAENLSPVDYVRLSQHLIE